MTDQFTGIFNAPHWFDITLNTPISFQLGVITDNSDGIGITPLNLTVTQMVGGSGAATTIINANLQPDYHLFNISGLAGDTFRISGENDPARNPNGIAGIFFDDGTPLIVAPVAVDDAYNTNEDTTLVEGAPGVLGNDTDANSDPLTAVVDSDPSNGTLTLNADGSFTYTPNANSFGTDSFTYHANDGTVDSNVATVTITVNAVNDTPVAVNDDYATDEDTALTVAAPGILGNDSDPVEGDPLTAVLDSGPSNGTLTLNADGSFTYDPVAGFDGIDTFTYLANDGVTDSTASTVTITVDDNQPPVASFTATPDSGTVPLSVSFDATASTDPDGSIVSYSWDFADGSPVETGDSVTHDFTAAGTYDVILTVTDDLGNTHTTTQSITVNPVINTCVHPANNIVTNGSFESNLSGWSYFSNGGGSANATTMDQDHCDYSAKLDFTGTGSNVQLYQHSIGLDASTDYTLSFRARATTPRNVNVYLHKHTAGYNNYGLNEGVNLTTDWQTFTYDFTSQGFSGSVSNARLRFWLVNGQTGDSMFFDNVVLQKADDVNPPQPVAPSIQAQPQDMSVVEDGTATFTASAQGTVPLTYQWQRDGVNTPGATAASYTTNTLADTDDGALFSVVVSNALGSETSDEALLTVTEVLNQLPEVFISVDNMSGAGPLTVIFDDSASSDPDGTIVSYEWDFDDSGSMGTGEITSHTFITPTVYDVSLTVTDNEGQTDTTTVTITVDDMVPDCVFDADNILTNGSFENTLSSWSYFSNGGGSANATTMDQDHCDYSAKLDFSGTGSNVQLYQRSIGLDASTGYTLSFRAKATTPRNVKVFLHKHTAGYNNYGLNGTVNLTTNWQTFTYNFTSKGFSGTVSDARLRFWLVNGRAGDSMLFDNVVLKKQ